MNILSRLFRHSDTETTNTYPADGAPPMDVTRNTGTVQFRPERVTVEHRNGRFVRMEIAGPVVGGPDGYHVIRRFDRERDVPEWARTYLNDNRPEVNR
ncbi:hypothetical protein GCM10011608_10370 [Micromonospora sonchi]|uniref:Uncharacterized protein n=1 Tax=Micromonospora sonchi TaxID=1763543 RepID=A0A917TMG1_9ACTN|nr:hypothetical protein [Micromonospora sonchi]GGM27506.1 hypothetical protein GCM10011608_10370 [Micromonospora sonchi]